MVQLEKILCLVFTLFVIYLVTQQCSVVVGEGDVVEGIAMNSFDACNDDPEWYTVGEGGKQYYCSDIGESASCYDLDPKQQEGWERCLQTCGNCANTEVTQAAQDNLAMYSGEEGEQYGNPLTRDESRNWVGEGVGDGDNTDVRSSITRDEGEDIVDIYDRLNIVEDMYDMLLSSVSSCIDCSNYGDSDDCPRETCEWDGITDQCILKQGLPTGQFMSCDGSELSCEYDITTDDDTTADDTTADDSLTSETKIHKYVKHECDTNGNCNIMFPTYEFNCHQIPTPSENMHPYYTLTYEPHSLENRVCLSDDYINPTMYTSPLTSKLQDIADGSAHVVNNSESFIASLNTLLSGEPSITTLDTVVNELVITITMYQTSILSLQDIPTDTSLFSTDTLQSKVDDVTSTSDTVQVLIAAVDDNDPTKTTTLTQYQEFTTSVEALQTNIQELTDIISDNVSIQNIVDHNMATRNNATPVSAPLGHECRGYIAAIQAEPLSSYVSDLSNITNTLQLLGKDWQVGDEVVLSDTGDSMPACSATDLQVDSVNTVTNTFTLKQNGEPVDAAYIQGLQTANCSLERIGGNRGTTIPRCYQLDNTEYVARGADAYDGGAKAKQSCAEYCNSPEIVDHMSLANVTGFIALNDNHECRCFTHSDTIQSQFTEEPDDSGICSGSHSHELFDEGKVIETQYIRGAQTNVDEDMQKMCKGFFLLEKSLTGEDIDPLESDTEVITGTSHRISLYDMCPEQCKAPGCSATS